jgi:hypothetical protein
VWPQVSQQEFGFACSARAEQDQSMAEAGIDPIDILLR